jgi:UDP-glucose 4-epimerase
MKLKNKSVLVTGGAGFIGSHLVDALTEEQPDTLVVVDNLFLGKDENLKAAGLRYPELQVYHEDASDLLKMKEIMEVHGTEVVFNLAVIPLLASLDKPCWTFKKNIDISINMCELALNDSFKTLIHFSSSEVYGTSIYAPMDENHPLNGTTTYAASKAASDLLVMSYYRSFGIDTSIIRPFNNYGPRQNERSYAGVIPITITRIMNGEKPIIHGDGRQTRDYLYVTDTADAAIKIYNSNKTRGKILNIASGKEIAIEYLVKIIAQYLHYDKEIQYDLERPADVRRHIANIYLAEDLIGFKQKITFEEGIGKTIDWYKSYLSRKHHGST